MTYIEFFDGLASDNIGLSVTREFDRIIFMGSNENQMRSQVKNYEELLKRKKPSIEILFEQVTAGDIIEAEAAIDRIVNTYDNCVFDITGGDSILVLALGRVSARNSDKEIQIQKMNLKKNIIFDCDYDGKTVGVRPPELLIEQHIRAYGGDIMFGTVDEYKKTYRWALTEEFLNDLAAMWEICKKDFRAWNAQMGVFSAMERYNTASEALTTTADRTKTEGYLKRNKADLVNITRITSQLNAVGLISDLDLSGPNLTVTYKNKRIKRCLVTAGQMLEMKVFAEAKRLRDEKGKAIYDDVLNGVAIDWDGKIHETGPDSLWEVKNEIDVMLMHDMIPVFISCKNGKFEIEELYKLNTVAEKFGNKYAKKVLVATAINADNREISVEDRQIIERAKSLGIRVIDKRICLDDEKLIAALKTVWNI